MNTHAAILTFATLVSAASLLPTAVRAGDCATALGALRVDFPGVAQDQRQHGTLQVGIRLNPEGRVVTAHTEQSSGHGRLDRAAELSARKHWRFDVSKCSAAELGIGRSVSVTFQRPPGVSVSITLNRKGLARTRALLADSQCHAVNSSNDTTVFSCKRTHDVLADARRE